MKQALITGGAHGLGRAMVDRLTQDGVQVAVIDIDCTPLQAVPGVTAIECDLTQAAGIDAVLAGLPGPIDLLIHAAGVSATGPFLDIPWDRQATVWALNFAAPMRLTQALLAAGQLHRRARLCFVSSLSAYVGYPGAASYAGSKDGLTSYARSLSKAHIARDMSVTVAFPGPLRTDHAARYAPDNSAASIARRMDPGVAAGVILADTARRKKTCLPGGAAKALALMGRIAPGLTGRLMRKAVFDKMDRVRI